MRQSQVQDRFIELANNSCYALCLVEWLNRFVEIGLERPSDYFRLVIEGYRNDWIDWNGTVTNPAAFLKICDPKHRTFKVSYVNGPNTSKYIYPVFYSIDGKNGHFVLSNVGGVVWNPLSFSKNVMYGQQISYRKIDIIG